MKLQPKELEFLSAWAREEKAPDPYVFPAHQLQAHHHLRGVALIRLIKAWTRKEGRRDEDIFDLCSNPTPLALVHRGRTGRQNGRGRAAREQRLKTEGERKKIRNPPSSFSLPPVRSPWSPNVPGPSSIQGLTTARELSKEVVQGVGSHFPLSVGKIPFMLNLSHPA